MFNLFNNFQDYGQPNMNSAVESLNGFERGLQAFSTEWSTYAERSMIEGQETMERMMKADSMETALEVQSDFAQSAYDAYLGHMSRFSNLYARMAEDAVRPVAKMSKSLH